MPGLTCLLLLPNLLGFFLYAAPAHAQLARTYVSAATGNDANNCDRATPCRTFDIAHSKTLANGEITVLTPGGYGAVRITKAISIINDGVGEAGILVSGGLNAITIDAAATDAVSLRGITVKGIGFGGGIGIRFNTGKSLSVENCVFRNLTGTGGAGAGIQFVPTNSSRLVVSNSFFADNRAAVEVEPSAPGLAVTATLRRVEMYNHAISGLIVATTPSSTTGTINVTAVDSVVVNTGAYGLEVNAGYGTATATLTVIRSVAAGNGTAGLQSAGVNAILRVSQSAVTGNTLSWHSSGGAVSSYGDNYIDDNGDSSPAPTLIADK